MTDYIKKTMVENMKMEQILAIIKDLAKSQGFYGRLLNDIMTLKENDPAKYDQLVTELESQNFKDPVDMVLYFET